MTQYRTFSQQKYTIYYMWSTLEEQCDLSAHLYLYTVHIQTHTHSPPPYTWLHDWVLTCWQFWSVWSSVVGTFHTLAPFIYSWGTQYLYKLIQIETSTHNHLLLCVLSTHNIIEWSQVQPIFKIATDITNKCTIKWVAAVWGCSF